MASTPLFDGNNGVYVATTGNADLTVQLSGGTSFPVDLDPLPTTVGQLADRIRSAAGGLVPAQFDTFVGEAGDVYLIDRGRAGAVGGFRSVERRRPICVWIRLRSIAMSIMPTTDSPNMPFA